MKPQKISSVTYNIIIPSYIKAEWPNIYHEVLKNLKIADTERNGWQDESSTKRLSMSGKMTFELHQGRTTKRKSHTWEVIRAGWQARGDRFATQFDHDKRLFQRKIKKEEHRCAPLAGAKIQKAWAFCKCGVIIIDNLQGCRLHG